jgi:chemotaxis protein histidine kinase CheA
MTADPFAERLARVQHRFVSTLETKIDDAYAAMPKLTDHDAEGVAAVDALYRSMHSVVGVGSTVGFPATGHAAHDLENVLRQAQLDGRALAADEIERFETCLHALREAATRELQSFNAVQQTG